MKATFMTPVVQAEGMNATGLRVPSEAVAAWARGRSPRSR